jgi:hypothetical protein
MGMIKEYFKKHGRKWLGIISLIFTALVIVSAIAVSVKVYTNSHPIKECVNCGRFHR